jgi:ribosomal-protein-alanine N-acetyltransferase
LPVLTGPGVTLRNLTRRDASSLVANLSTDAVLRYIARCPSSVAGFERFIRWSHRERRCGRFICFGIIPAGHRRPVGVVQLWPIEPNSSTAEWGFALGERYWGMGLFEKCAALLLDFAFGELDVFRVEARAVDANRRGNGALEKIGARREAVLRRGFRDGTTSRDYVMWSILADEWAARCYTRAAINGKESWR